MVEKKCIISPNHVCPLSKKKKVTTQRNLLSEEHDEFYPSIVSEDNNVMMNVTRDNICEFPKPSHKVHMQMHSTQEVVQCLLKLRSNGV